MKCGMKLPTCRGMALPVVDSGVQSWADLQQDISGANRMLTWTHFSDDVTKSAEDAQGHGSHVAGIIGGSVIGRRDAKLMKAYPAYLVTSSNQSTPYYFRMSGTSMAAPMVTGAVALLLQDEPWLTPDQVKYRLMATARPFAGPQPGSTGAGYLDIYAAVHGTTTENANVGIPMSQFLGDGTGTTIWNSINWNSVNWNSADPVWSFIIDEDPEP
jgi:subtilisin family serine protease